MIHEGSFKCVEYTPLQTNTSQVGLASKHTDQGDGSSTSGLVFNTGKKVTSLSQIF